MDNTKQVSLCLTLGFALGVSTAIASSTVQAADIVYNPPADVVQAEKSGKLRGYSRGFSRGFSRGYSRGFSRGYSRGACGSISKGFSLRVLVPAMGHTVSAQPTLYWSVSQDLPLAQFEVAVNTVMSPGSFDFPEPLLDKKFYTSAKKGIHALSLAKYNVTLDKNTEYEWSISLVCDADNPSANIFDNGGIKRVTPKFYNAGQQTAYTYAKNGVWYDALDTLSKQIEKKPNDRSLRQVRASLLRQGGLDKVAALNR